MKKQLETKLSPTSTPSSTFKPTGTPSSTFGTPGPTPKRVPEGVLLNTRNMKNIQFEIQRKKYSENPYYATQKNVTQVITDYDELPYRRWYRGVPESEFPIVAEREAGYRPLIRQIYIEKRAKPEQCFERKKDMRKRQGSPQQKRDSEEEDSKKRSSKQKRDEEEDDEDEDDDEKDRRHRQKRESKDDERDKQYKKRKPRDNGGWKNIDNYTSVMLRTV